MWFRIVFAFTLIGSAIGAFIFTYFPTELGKFLGVTSASLGLGIGIYFAIKIWKNQGTSAFLAEEFRTPESDNNNIK